MPASKYDLKIEQGADFLLSVAWADSAGSPVDLSGYSARAQVRASHNSPDVLLSFDSSKGSIELGGEEGTILLTATAEATSKVASGGVWDLELIDSTGKVKRLLEGRVRLSKEVTR
jgi:hypothetical protein